MQKAVIGVALAAMTPLLLAADSSPRQTAAGVGSMVFTGGEEGVGVLYLEIDKGRETSGSLTFAAEHHHEYPDVVIRVERIDTAEFDGRTVTFTAKGHLQDEPVHVSARAWDGVGTKEADGFHIRCTNGDGEEVFHAHGDLTIGDVRISTAR